MIELPALWFISWIIWNDLHQHACNIFKSRTVSRKSWFHQIRRLCLKYDLPHPSSLLSMAPSKQVFKILVKKRVISFWEIQLRAESSSLTSLTFFKPHYLSLTKPHPMISSAGLSPAKVSMATVQMRLISGRYRTNHLTRHWSKSRSPICSLSPDCNEIEDVRHFLQTCPALMTVWLRLDDYVISFCEATTDLPAEACNLLKQFCNPRNLYFCDFLLDCSTLPAVINLVQCYGNHILSAFFTVTRTYCFVLHRERRKLQGSWKR